MTRTTKDILHRAKKLARDWEAESLAACGRAEDVLKAKIRRDKVFDYLAVEIDRLSQRAGDCL